MTKAIELAHWVEVGGWAKVSNHERDRLKKIAIELRRLAAVEQENANILAANKYTSDPLDQALQELAEAKELLRFVERWANHHGAKPGTTAELALSCIQHHPGIVKITKSYADGVIPDTPNPWQELAGLKAAMGEPVAFRIFDKDPNGGTDDRWVYFSKEEFKQGVEPASLGMVSLYAKAKP